MRDREQLPDSDLFETAPSLREIILEKKYKEDQASLEFFTSIPPGSQPTSEQLAKAKEFLANRWEAVKGTYLSYTSVPDSAVSKLCYQIAERLSEYENQSALSYLIPTIEIFTDVVLFEDIRENTIRRNNEIPHQ